MFSLAEVWGFRPDHSNPCHLIERYKENQRERFLAESEVATLGSVLAELEDLGTELSGVLNGIRLLLLTGCRLGEMLALQWTDVDFGRGLLVIRDAKAGAREHAVGAPTLAFLAELPRTGKWVVHGRNPDKPLSISTIGHAWERIRERAG